MPLSRQMTIKNPHTISAVGLLIIVLSTGLVSFLAKRAIVQDYFPALR